MRDGGQRKLCLEPGLSLEEVLVRHLQQTSLPSLFFSFLFKLLKLLLEGSYCGTLNSVAFITAVLIETAGIAELVFPVAGLWVVRQRT